MADSRRYDTARDTSAVRCSDDDVSFRYLHARCTLCISVFLALHTLLLWASSSRDPSSDQCRPKVRLCIQCVYGKMAPKTLASSPLPKTGSIRDMQSTTMRSATTSPHKALGHGAECTILSVKQHDKLCLNRNTPHCHAPLPQAPQRRPPQPSIGRYAT